MALFRLNNFRTPNVSAATRSLFGRATAARPIAGGIVAPDEHALELLANEPPEGGPDGLERRLFLAGALALTGALVAGCAGGNSASRMPGPVWPDMESGPVPSGGPTTWYPVGQAPVRGAPTGRLPAAPVGPAQGVIGRAAWTRAQLNPAKADRMGMISRITVHHDAIPSTSIRSQSDAARRMESVRMSHLRNGWADIGYHYVIDPQGRVWEGRPLSWQGAHVQDNNPGNLGIMVMGNFDQHRPTSEAMSTIDGFVASQARRYGLPASRVFTHQEIKPTACPGRNLQRYMQETRGRSGRLFRNI
jgi:hypothetical protein